MEVQWKRAIQGENSLAALQAQWQNHEVPRTEEEDLEDTVSHLSIYLTGLDELYREQATQLKHQIHWAEKATQEMKEQRTRAVRAEYSLAALQVQWQEHEAHRGVGGWIEEDPEETHWDRGTQSKDDVMEQCLPPKKCPIQTEEESP